MFIYCSSISSKLETFKQAHMTQVNGVLPWQYYDTLVDLKMIGKERPGGEKAYLYQSQPQRTNLIKIGARVYPSPPSLAKPTPRRMGASMRQRALAMQMISRANLEK